MFPTLATAKNLDAEIVNEVSPETVAEPSSSYVGRSNDWQGFQSIAISFILHTLAFLALAFVAFTGLSPGPASLIMTLSDAGDQGEQLGEMTTTIEISAPEFGDFEQANQSQPLRGGDDKSDLTTQLSHAPALTTLLDTGDDSKSTAPSIGDTVSELALVSSRGDQEMESGSGGKSGQATFFGSTAYGNRFVYVIDASRSMEGYRWNRAMGELLKSIRELGDGTEFFVIAFHMTAIPVEPSRAITKQYLVKDKNSAIQVRRWLRELELGPETMPASALSIAMDFRPDAIFLLSDGELRDNTMFLLRQTNHNDLGVITPIHCVHLFSSDGKETLQMLAQENGGTFTAIGTKRKPTLKCALRDELALEKIEFGRYDS
jgi:hypothetical protein